MLQFIIEDFQSIQKAKIGVSGITLIVGESNQGKSACVRALQSACLNRFKAGQVSYGKPYSLIRLKDSDDSRVLTVRRNSSGGSPIVTLGDQTFSKLNRNIPKEMREYLNLGFMEVTGETYSCNFHSQFQRPLLLEYSQQRVMEMMSISKEIDKLNIAKSRVLQDRTQLKGAIAVVDKTIQETRESLKSKKDLKSKVDCLVDEFKEPFDYYTELCSKLDVVDILNSCLQDLSTTEEWCNLLELKRDCLNSVLNLYKKLVFTDSLDEVLKQESEEESKQEIYEELLLLYSNKAPFLYEKTCLLTEQLTSYVESTLICRDLYSKQQLYNSLISYNKKLTEIESNLLKFTLLFELQSQIASIDVQINNFNDIVNNRRCPICGNVVSM